MLGKASITKIFGPINECILAMVLLETLVQLLSLMTTGLYANECDSMSKVVLCHWSLHFNRSVIKGSRGLAHVELEDLPRVKGSNSSWLLESSLICSHHRQGCDWPFKSFLLMKQHLTVSNSDRSTAGLEIMEWWLCQILFHRYTISV